MSGIDKIKARIASDAQREGDEILAAAKKEADEIVAKIHSQAAELTEQLTQRGEKEAAARKERQIGVAALEARKRRLAAKQEMIGKAFDMAAAEIAALDQEKLSDLLARLAAKASRNGKEQIALSKSDHARLGTSVTEKANAILKKENRAANLVLSENPREITGGGLMLSDGDIEINATFAAMVSSLKTEMSAEVAKVLFE